MVPWWRVAIRLREADVRESTIERLVGLAFWTLSVLCLLNPNGLIRMWTGEERAVSDAILICCLLALAGLMRVGPREALGIPGALILSCLLSYSGIGIVVAIVAGADLQEAQWYLVRHVKSALLIFGAAVGGRVLWRRVGGERMMRGLLVVMTASCTLILASPWLLIVLRFPPPDGELRFFGSFADPNEAGLMACFTVVTVLALIESGRSRRSRVFARGALLVAVAALVSTFSRTALVVLPLVLLGSLLASRGAGRRRIARSVVLVTVAVLGVLATVDIDTLDERRVSRWNSLIDVSGSSSVEDLSLGDRTLLWSLALEQTLEAPLVGNGLGRLHALDGAWYNREGVLLGAHNQYLILAGEAGFLPLVPFVLFLVLTLQAGLRRKASWPLGVASGWAIVLTVFSMTFHGVLTYRICNFIIGLICVATAGRSRDDGPPPEAT